MNDIMIRNYTSHERINLLKQIKLFFCSLKHLGLENYYIEYDKNIYTSNYITWGHEDCSGFENNFENYMR